MNKKRFNKPLFNYKNNLIDSLFKKVQKNNYLNYFKDTFHSNNLNTHIFQSRYKFLL